MGYLGIDAGASATKWAYIGQAGVVRSGAQESMDGHIYRPASLERMRRVLSEIQSQLKGLPISGVLMGITGVSKDGSIEKEINSIYKCDATVISDIELAYKANFKDSKGILLYAGTGSVAYALGSEAHQIGGWGYLLGDEGAGYWIGREGIRNALLKIEQKEKIKNDILADQILKAMNATDWTTIKNFVYSQDRSKIAALSKIVNNCAEQGDADALSIMQQAAIHLSELVFRIDGHLLEKSLPIIFTGGLSLSNPLTMQLKKILQSRFSISNIDIAVRAAELAG